MRSYIIKALLMASAIAAGKNVYSEMDRVSVKNRNNRESQLRRMVEYERKTKGEVFEGNFLIKGQQIKAKSRKDAIKRYQHQYGNKKGK